MTDKDVTVGVGGAIVDLSDPQDELDEMILKSQALVKALSETDLDTEHNTGAFQHGSISSIS